MVEVLLFTVAIGRIVYAFSTESERVKLVKIIF